MTGDESGDDGDPEQRGTPDHDLETDPQAWASPDPEESPETIFDPEELDISDRAEVEQTGENRFVVSTDGAAVDPDPPANPQAALGTLAGELADTDGHALAVAVTTEEGTETLHLDGGSTADTLAGFLSWYARTVEPGQPVDETIGALLDEIDLGSATGD